jgi:hypothetical protein
MNATFGLSLIAFTAAMIVVARPSDGISAPFLRIWIVGQIYTLIALVSAVMGVSLLIISLPG